MVNYAFKDFSKNTVKAYGTNLDISVKAAINICNKIRGMDANKALAFLDKVTKKQEAVPFTRFTDGVGHKPGMAAGRYPLKAAKAIGDVIASAVSNAANQGFAEELDIIHICAHKAETPLHQGRQRRRVMKRTHIEVVLKESESKSKATKKKADAKPVKKDSTLSTASDTKSNTASSTAIKKSESKENSSPEAKIKTKPIEKNVTSSSSKAVAEAKTE